MVVIKKIGMYTSPMLCGLCPGRHFSIKVEVLKLQSLCSVQFHFPDHKNGSFSLTIIIALIYTDTKGGSVNFISYLFFL